MMSRWRITWQIDDDLLNEIRDFCRQHENNLLVRRRYERNILHPPTKLSPELIWRALVMCLLSSNQRSGPGSPLHRFLLRKPFPLSLEVCTTQGDGLATYASRAISDAGLRRGLTIGEQLHYNLQKLKRTDWTMITLLPAGIDEIERCSWERDIAIQLSDGNSPLKLSGIGPKQSRNLLQILGLTHYEIPIDSTVAGILNKWDFPVPVHATLLQNADFYAFVNDAVIDVCEKINLMPCVFDACLFASEYKGEWTEETMIF